jgi:hypothetical protein
MTTHDATTATADRLSAGPTVTGPAAVRAPGLGHPHAVRAFHRIRLLLGGYLAAGVLTLAAAAVLSRTDSSAVNAAVWIRGTFVAAGALVMFLCAGRAARGSRGAYRRLRILSAVTVAAIVAVVSLPGTFPLWMKADQVACGLVLVAIVAVTNSRAVRALFDCPPAGKARS